MSKWCLSHRSVTLRHISLGHTLHGIDKPEHFRLNFIWIYSHSSNFTNCESEIQWRNIVGELAQLKYHSAELSMRSPRIHGWSKWSTYVANMFCNVFELNMRTHLCTASIKFDFEIHISWQINGWINLLGAVSFDKKKPACNFHFITRDMSLFNEANWIAANAICVIF